VREAEGEKMPARIISWRAPIAVLGSLVVLGACSARESLGRNLVDHTEAGAAVPVPTIPKPKETCPAMAGLAGTDVTFLGNAVTVWSGPAGRVGPMVFYWHATTAAADEAIAGLGPGTSEVVKSGGVIAAFQTSKGWSTSAAFTPPATARGAARPPPWSMRARIWRASSATRAAP
jgi:hypothetical protein